MMMIEPVLHYIDIDGRFRPGLAGRTFPMLNPATNAPLTEVAEGLAEDVDAAVRAARRAFDEGPWPRLKAAERARVLTRIADAIKARAEDIAALEVLDVGMPITQARAQSARPGDNFLFRARDPGSGRRRLCGGPGVPQLHRA